MPNAQQLRAARIARHIASSGDYDPDCVSLMFQQADQEVKEILAETTEVNAIEKTFGPIHRPRGPALVPSKNRKGSENSEHDMPESP